MSDGKPPIDDRPGDGPVHLSMDEIADLEEGLLAPDRTTAARAHLERCTDCSARAATLASATQALHDLEPIPMPPDVAARIDAALVAEAGAARPAGDAEVGAPMVIPNLSTIPRQRIRRPSLAAASAAAVLILLAGAIVVGLTAANGHHHTPTEVAGGASGLAPLVGSPPAGTPRFSPVSTGRTYRPSSVATLVSGLLTTAPAFSAESPTNGAGTGAPGTGSSAASGGSAAGSADSTAGTTPQSQHHAAAQKGRGSKGVAHPPIAAAIAPPRTPLTKTAPVPTQLTHLFSDQTALLQCAATATDTTGAVPLAVDFGRWTNPTATPPIKNVPAVIFVFADASDSTVADVWVVAASCDGSSLLDFTKVALPK